MRAHTLFQLAATLLLATTTTAFWRLPCPAAVVTERIDPVVSPNSVSAHAHAIMGASNINYTSTFEDLRASGCTSCQVTQDLSAYWVPNMYFHDKQTGKFTSLQQTGGMLAYYIQRYGYTGEQLYAFPDGFRMLAGNPNARSSYGTVESQAISYHCLDYTNPAIPETGGFPSPNQACPNGIRQQIFFPSCWDGVNVDSPDHKSHVAYPSNSDSGTCPSTHPYRLISLFYEVIWWSIPYAAQIAAGTGEFVLSNGDPTGYSSHADFVNGWDYDVLQRAVDTCLADSGVFTDCPVFNTISQQQATQCKIAPHHSEAVLGTLDALPGNNPVQYGPGNASPVAYDGTIPRGARITPWLGLSDASVRNGTQFPKPIQVVSRGCYSDGYPLSRSLAGLGPYGIFNTNSMTNELCSRYCLAQGFAFSGTEYSTQCFCANSMPTTPSTKCNMPCAGSASQVCGGDNALSVYYNPAGAKFVAGGGATPTTTGSTGASTGYTTSGSCNGVPFASGAYVCWGGKQLCQVTNGKVFRACSGACYDPTLYSCPSGFLQPAGTTSTGRPKPPSSRPKAPSLGSTTQINWAIVCLFSPSRC